MEIMTGTTRTACGICCTVQSHKVGGQILPGCRRNLRRIVMAVGTLCIERRGQVCLQPAVAHRRVDVRRIGIVTRCTCVIHDNAGAAGVFAVTSGLEQALVRRGLTVDHGKLTGMAAFAGWAYTGGPG